MNEIIITIDGYSSCGKSTLAKDLAAALAYGYVDSGAMYRSVTLFLLRNEIEVEDVDTIKRVVPDMEITFKSINGTNHTFLNGENVEGAIRKMFVSEKVSYVAAIPEVRHAMVAIQRDIGKSKGIVMDGRDIGTVVFPNAELKIFLVADLDIRVERRYSELKEKGIPTDRPSVEKNLLERDRLDSTRTESPLKKAAEAVLIDNTNLTRKEQLAMVLALAQQRINHLHFE